MAPARATTTPSSPTLRTLLLLGLLSPLASADIIIATDPQTTTAPVVETASVLDASGIPITTANDPADNAWYIPLTGPASSPTGAAWGARIQYNNDALNEILPIAFSANPSATATTSTSAPSATATLSSATSPGEGNQNGTLETPLTSTTTLLLGTDSTFNLTIDGNSSSLSTLPLGLNLGLQGKWNGSIVLGGNYDANRIYDESHWQTLPETSAGNTSFISTGLSSISAVVLQLYSSTPNTSASAATAYPFDTTTVDETSKNLTALLDFNSEVISVPDDKWCGRNISVVFNPASEAYPEFEIPIWAELIPAGQRCVVAGDTVTLGRPFFQATYLYVTAEGDLYFSSVTTEDLEVQLKTFDLHSALSEDAADGGNGTTVSVKGSGTSAGVGGGLAGESRVLGGLMGLLVMVVVLGCL
ncbi:hypothetical protein BO71DRAFT_230774 [Aspergillus ellipticus CBS 707.79]|uniref:Acid protease n=1 Tax=Aspergillus ellipticus CBS 707.79 TaxID=1448320 RepID=A0A319DSR7_9EURO|nr:hypothetical protein BO71DRAFT_230774 [Aspergillus ellipticus CBS 707.79]